MDSKKSKDKKDMYIPPGKHAFDCGRRIMMTQQPLSWWTRSTSI